MENSTCPDNNSAGRWPKFVFGEGKWSWILICQHIIHLWNVDEALGQKNVALISCWCEMYLCMELVVLRNWLGERHFHESVLVMWHCSKAVSRNCNILLQVWQHLMLLWLNCSYILRILTLKVKINFSPGLSLRGPKYSRKRTTVYDLKIFCVLFYSTVIVIGLDCLAAVKYVTKTEVGQ